MNISFVIAALVFIGNDDEQPERHAGSDSIVPTAWLPCRVDDSVPLLLAAPNQIKEVQSA